MREGLFILVVVLILLGLTALRYRKQIAGIIGVAKMLQDAKASAAVTRTDAREPARVQLVNCEKCGVWVPQDKAVRGRDGQFYCSKCS